MTKACIPVIVGVVLLGGCPVNPDGQYVRDPAVMLVFHNNSGAMCLEALAWIEQLQAQYPALQVEERLTTEPAELALLTRLRDEFPRSSGVSSQFFYLPIIFYQDQAYSGFNEQVAAALEALVAAASSAGP
jgi:hypothetical protein